MFTTSCPRTAGEAAGYHMSQSNMYPVASATWVTHTGVPSAQPSSEARRSRSAMRAVDDEHNGRARFYRCVCVCERTHVCSARMQSGARVHFANVAGSDMSPTSSVMSAPVYPHRYAYGHGGDFRPPPPLPPPQPAIGTGASALVVDSQSPSSSSTTHTTPVQSQSSGGGSVGVVTVRTQPDANVTDDPNRRWVFVGACARHAHTGTRADARHRTRGGARGIVMSTQKRSTLVYNDELKALMSEINARIDDCRTLVSAPVVANAESTARAVRIVLL